MRRMFLALLVALVVAAPSFAAPLGTGFTYQGQLVKAGTPYTGTGNFVFRLWNAASGGTQVGSDFTVTGLAVNGGLFTADLNFGSVFDGTALWVEVQVQTAGDASPTTLTPRQLLAAAPYALHALNAASGSGPWITGTSGIHTLGNVGVGATAGPDIKLYVNSGTANINPFYATNNNASYAAMVVRNFGGSNSWGLYDDTSGRHYVAGKLGAGIAPEYPIDVQNTLGPGMRIAAYGSSIVTPGEGVRSALYVHGYTGTGVLGRTQGGIYASSTDARGVAGVSVNDWGVSGDCLASGTFGILGSPNEGVFGFTPNTTLPAGKFNAPAGGVAIEANGLAKVKTLQIMGGADLAEPFDVASSKNVKADPGTVVVIDASSPGDLRVSDAPYDTRVAGVVSGANGLEPGMVMKADGHVDGKHPVALTGRVWCKVDASFGAVAPGDLLTTSPRAGHAMKASDATRRAGAVIGKAMTALETGRGLVLVLVNLQ